MHTASNLRLLAPRQAEALTHRVRGLSNKETAEAMQCSVANVTNLLTECFYKLHAPNRTEAVAKAVKHGLTQFALIASVLSGIGTDAQEQLRTRIQRRPTIRTIRIRNNREGIV